MKFVIALSLLVLLVSSARSDSSLPNLPDLVDELEKMIDWSVDPCDDFYQFACGGWIKANTLPSDKSILTRSFTMIGDRNQEILKEVVENSAHTKLNTFFESCMDTDAMDKLGAKPIQPLLSSIRKLASNGLNSQQLMTLAGKMSLMGIPTVFNFGAIQNSDVPENTIAGPSLGLPSISMYQDDNTVSEYYKYLTTLFKLAGNSPRPDEDAMLAIVTEATLANYMLPPDKMVDPFTTFNPMPLSKLSELTGLPIGTFMETVGVNYNGTITIDTPAYFANLTNAFRIAPKGPAYFLANVLRTYAPRLSEPFRTAHFNFYAKFIGGQQEPAPRWRQCIASVDSSLGELLGKYYADQAFPGSSETDAVSILDGILAAMKEDIQSISWMDSVTRSRALDKLSLVGHQIGEPSHPLDYSDVSVGQVYFSNVDNATQASILRDFDRIGKPTDRNVWEMTADTVNAYYDPTLNMMVFPAGILQQPMFNHTYPMEMNYGGIGMVMGHELTHGFDNQGRLYNGHGRLVNWWEPNTSKEFDDKVQCIIDQYSKFEPIPGVHVNGKLTQGENVADNGGLANSYRSALSQLGQEEWDSPSILNNPGKTLTRGQLFFVNFAGGWCSVVSDNYYRLHTKTDPHSPPQYRVIGPTRNLKGFSDTFQCPSGSGQNPVKKCKVW